MHYPFLKKLRKLPQHFIFDTGDYRQTVFLAGVGRSGTTWVQEIINSRNDFRVIFEPFHQQKVDLPGDWNPKQYLRYNDQRDKFLKTAACILSGNIKNKWTDQFNRKIIARKRLIKAIRSNLVLKWIKYNFPEISLILLLRHPCAVANSKLKVG